MFSLTRKKTGRRAAPAPQSEAQAAAATRVQSALKDARRRLAAAEKKHRKAKEDVVAALCLTDVAARREVVERLQAQAGLIETGDPEAIADPDFEPAPAPAYAARH